MADESLEVMYGTLDLLILKVLTWGPDHGYGVVRRIRDGSRVALTIEDRALYLALHRLEERELIAAEWGVSENKRRAKYYRITADGRRELKARVAYWNRFAGAVFELLGAEAPTTA